jgi:UDP-N-acetylglucosamine 2-epimerase (non-hydrolysing)
MRRLKVMNIVGARPNFMKIAPLMRVMQQHPAEIEALLVHTGQHYDAAMSETFFQDLGISQPDINLEVGSASHAVQTAKVMLAFEPVVLAHRPDWVVVVGDVNSTLACTVVCSKLGIKVAHVEAGLRSFDRQMPEEINRIVTDALADLLLTPSADADENLRREGTPEAKIRCVGNIMIDTLYQHLPQAAQRPILDTLQLTAKQYGVITLHRPANVDDPAILAGLLDALISVAATLPCVFPVHPRTRERLQQFGLLPRLENTALKLIEPLGYLDFLQLYSNARLVLTDSGGIQEETSALGIACLTLRENTERPITVTLGTNRIVGTDPTKIVQAATAVLQHNNNEKKEIPLWDGHTAQRIVGELLANSLIS